jgi:hypothetical protein
LKDEAARFSASPSVFGSPLLFANGLHANLLSRLGLPKSLPRWVCTILYIRAQSRAFQF